MSVTAVRPEIDHEKARDLEWGGASWARLWSRIEAVRDAQRAVWAQDEGGAEGLRQSLASLAAAAELLVDDLDALQAQSPPEAAN